MAFFRCDVMSESLGMATSVLVTMPDTGDLAAAPVVYLLHGLTDNCTGWLRYTQAEHLARTHGAILIVPEVQRSFYTDMACGPKYFTYINQGIANALPPVFRHSARTGAHLYYGAFDGRIRCYEMRFYCAAAVRRVRRFFLGGGNPGRTAPALPLA